MPLHENSRLLVETLENLTLLDGRFKDIRLVNFDVANDEKRGCFSLVFRAYDTVEDAPVALKFYDPDPVWTTDLYRIASFQRECEILKGLLDVSRCLQLVKAIGSYDLQVDIGSGRSLTLSCRYFAVEWIAEDIDDYFLNQDKIDAIDKLKLFNDIVLAVEALHTNRVFHRDLKMDNFRNRRTDGNGPIVAIDLGTAARLESSPIAVLYGNHVGAPAYASPEAVCGFSGIRELGPANDTYALGCLLFELFNRDLFYQAIRACNTNLDARIAVMGAGIPRAAPSAHQLKEWKQTLDVLAVGVTAPRSDPNSTSAPPGLVPLIDSLVSDLTQTDFRKRPTLSVTRRRIWSGIALLRNAKQYQNRVDLLRKRRQQRIEKLANKQAKLRARLEKPDTQKC